MLLLTTTSDVLRVVTGSAATVEVHASWVDNANGTITPGSTNTADITTAATTTIVAAPAASTQRNVKALTISNVHATVSTTVEVELFNGTIARRLWNGTLLAGEAVVFDQTGEWAYYAVTGALKDPAALLDAKRFVASDYVNATISFTDVTGLTQNLQSGKKYGFEAALIHQTNATTTAAIWGVNIGAAPTTLIVHAINQITVHVTAAAWASTASATARDTDLLASATTGPGAVNMLANIFGFITPSADGTFAIRGRSEVAVAAGLTVKAGSWLRIWEMDA